ncbi:HpcH/HpaI aldolase/citrate lyase family protein [Arvimicrobium flavum]|uniref:HpcH/HpaI aldolase/citrate lyase family protein n=1 Tax=Arvimicrobium flavum TaxID=3393320 RepID=UPI00237A324E|nr:CoA ester lyase [Mesorhizobium shangrilense]
MRSLLFVPGDSEKKLAKGFQSETDVVIVDLEDSVAPANKVSARQIAREFIDANRGGATGRIYVRVNELNSGEIDLDLKGIMSTRPDGIMLPKCSGGQDVEQLSAKLRVHEAENGIADGATLIIPLITETAASVLAASTYRPQARIAGLTWGAEDLSASIGARTARDEAGAYTDVFRLARALTLLAASASDVAAIDTVFPDFRNEAAFRSECIAAERDGFTAKMAIHPAQVAIINEVFTPSADAVAQSAAVVEAFRSAGNPGVVAIDGKMYDRPHLRLAERLLARARKT